MQQPLFSRVALALTIVAAIPSALADPKPPPALGLNVLYYAVTH